VGKNHFFAEIRPKAKIISKGKNSIGIEQFVPNLLSRKVFNLISILPRSRNDLMK